MKIIKSSPALQSTTRTGKSKFWQAHVVTDGARWFTKTTYWQSTKTGEKSTILSSEPYEATPKNVGKKNETTAEQQAHLEFESMVQKQIDKGYVEEGKTSEILVKPMLAEKFSERGEKLQWPVFVQPKFNGMRMLYDGTKAWSRGGKLIIPQCIQHLQFDTKGAIIDGELILPGNVLLQKTMEAAKKWRPGISDTLKYFIYDVVLPDVPYSERLRFLQSLKLPNNVCIASTVVAHDVVEVMGHHTMWTKYGYEGTMLRDDSDGYKIGFRSNQLQKLKDFVDAEFKIVEVKEGDGKFKGSAVFICETTDGMDTFRCTPEGTMDYRRQLWNDRHLYLGKWLTVRYQELSKDLKPIFPVGVEIRDENEFK